MSDQRLVLILTIDGPQYPAGTRTPPTASRYAEQDYAGDVISAMQNDAIIHDGPNLSVP